MNVDKILALLDDIKHELIATAPAPLTPPPDDAPFGRDYAGKPLFAPAYDKCRALWESAQREGWPGPDGKPFTIFDYVPGLQALTGAPRTAPYQGNLRKLEDDIVALGFSDKGQEWLKSDENAAMIYRTYALKFLGYYVTLVDQNNRERGFQHRNVNGAIV